MRGLRSAGPARLSFIQITTMKKFMTYGLSACLCLGFVACDNYEEPNPAPQTNPQAPVMKVEDLTIASTLTTEVYNLATLNDANTPIEVGTITTSALPAGYEFRVVAQVSANDFASYGEFDGEVVAPAEGDVYKVTFAPDALQGAYYANITHDPSTASVKVRYALYTVTGDQKARIGGNDWYVGPYELSLKPFDPTIIIEDAYYLIGSSDGNFKLADAVKLGHSGGSPYDNPVFSLKFDVASPDWQWILAPASTVATGRLDGKVKLGSEYEGEMGLGGTLIQSTNVYPFALGETGPYLLTVNIETKEFSWSLAIEQLYTPGDANGWSQGASQILTTTDYVNYSGMAVLSPNGFKFSSQPDWNGINYGNAGEEGKLSTDGGAGNLAVPELGLYFCSVNISDLTYTTALTSVWGVIGSATPNGWDASTNLTPDEKKLVWTGSMHLTAGELKLRANDAWDIDFGGALNNLEYKGANIVIDETGDFDVVLDFSQVPYTLTLTKK